MVTLGRDTGPRSQARMRLDDETPQGQEHRKSVAADMLADLRTFDPSRLTLRGRLDYEAVLFNVRAETIARERFALQPLFKTPIDGNVEVRKLTPTEERAGRVGYRVAPSLDGSRPGVYS